MSNFRGQNVHPIYPRRDKSGSGDHNGGSGGDGMDTRIANLERDMTDVKVALGKVETRLSHIETTMLTKGQTAAYALLGMIAVFGAGWWVVQQYLAPLVSALPQ